MSVVLETTVGDITVDLYLKERPNACLNFLKLCRIKYYNLCIFHKVERNFIAQTGDPTSTGRGGESVFCHLYGEQAKYFDAELKPRLKHEKLGTLSMVNNGNNMNGSQFFITLGENITYLDEVHTVFGEVAEGFDVLLKINEAICDPHNRPYQDIRITHTVILHDPFEDPPALEIPDASPIPTREQLESNYIGADEEIDDTEGKNAGEIEEKIKESEAKARATILEMVGDIPDADVKPPENVLFVCKLNPVTTSEDLEIIFSRFGPIVSCEVIKDKTSGESLQYAFIEFEKEENCENAYFKMANCLIDDRRIHVDFSQSVSKLNWNSQSKFPKQNSGRFQNFLIKDREKKSDGYEMIFDMEQGSTRDKQIEKNKNRSTRRQKRSSPEHRHDRRHTTFPSSKEKYKQTDKYFEGDRASYKKSTYDSGISKSDRGFKENELSPKEKSRSRTCRSPSIKRADKQKLKPDSSCLSDSENTYKKSYRKKHRHDSSSSNHSVSPIENRQQKYSTTTQSSHRNSKEKPFAERRKHDSYTQWHSNSPESYSKGEYSYKQKYRSQSRSSERSTNKKKSTLKENPSQSTSPDSSKRKPAKQTYHKSPSTSPESSNRKKKVSKSSYRRSQSRSQNSNNKRKTSKQRSSSPQSSSRKKTKKSLSRSPETSKYKRKYLKQKSLSRLKSSSPEIIEIPYQKMKATKEKHSFARYQSRSPEIIEISYRKMKATKERHSYARYQSRSPEPIKQKRKYSNKSSSSRSGSPDSPKQKERTSKHISRQPRSSSRSSETSNKKWTSNHKSNHKSGDESKFQMRNKLKSKSRSKNLTKYDYSSDSDQQQSDHKSTSKPYISSSKKKSHKNRKRSSS